VANSSGVSSHNAARRFGFGYAAASIDELLQDREVDLVVLGTPHNLHAPQVIAALEAGKHVFVEKPLCLSHDELDAIRRVAEAQPRLGLMVGFNRRFSPLSGVVQKATRARREPMVVHYRVDAGYLPRNHWAQERAVGGGRLLGEGCHFIDWMYRCVGRPVLTVRALSTPDAGRYSGDNLILELVFDDGSLGTLTYVANGSTQLGKERVEVFCEGQTIVLDDFRTVTVTRKNDSAAVTEKLRQVDKGHAEECRLVVEGLKSGTGMPIPQGDIFHVTEVTLLAEASRVSGGAVQILSGVRTTP
jgi:predicted dehydrogenase